MKKHETKAKDPEKVDQAKASEAEAPVEETENPLQKELDEAIAKRDEYLKLAQLAGRSLTTTGGETRTYGPMP